MGRRRHGLDRRDIRHRDGYEFDHFFFITTGGRKDDGGACFRVRELDGPRAASGRRAQHERKGGRRARCHRGRGRGRDGGLVGLGMGAEEAAGGAIWIRERGAGGGVVVVGG